MSKLGKGHYLAIAARIADTDDYIMAIVNQQSKLESEFLTASELSLRASQAAMLHAGAREYLQGSPQERKLRKGYSVAIATPTIKQLKKMLYLLSKKPFK